MNCALPEILYVTVPDKVVGLCVRPLGHSSPLAGQRRYHVQHWHQDGIPELPLHYQDTAREKRFILKRVIPVLSVSKRNHILETTTTY